MYCTVAYPKKRCWPRGVGGKQRAPSKEKESADDITRLKMELWKTGEKRETEDRGVRLNFVLVPTSKKRRRKKRAEGVRGRGGMPVHRKKAL